MQPIKIIRKWAVPSWNTRKLFADDDKDKVPNVFDCQPQNRRKQDGEWGNAFENEKKFERFDDQKETDDIITRLTKSGRFRKIRRYQ